MECRTCKFHQEDWGYRSFCKGGIGIRNKRDGATSFDTTCPSPNFPGCGFHKERVAVSFESEFEGITVFDSPSEKREWSLMFYGPLPPEYKQLEVGAEEMSPRVRVTLEVCDD